MKIIAQSQEMNGKDLYRMTKNAAIQKMREAANSTLKVECWVRYEDEDSKGNVREIVSIREAGTGIVYATNSPTFIRAFVEILGILEGCGEKLDELEVIEGTSKGGRSFITCGL